MPVTTARAQLVCNARVDRTDAYPEYARQLISAASCQRARATLLTWEKYAPTPLRSLPALARSSGLASILYKDEAGRFGLGSFKALGGAYAVSEIVSRAGTNITVACATDGNHGRAVAWGAARAGCRCVVYLHEGVSEVRAQAIAAYGASIVRVPGNYDDSVEWVERDAVTNAWHLVSDASAQADLTSCAILHGYGTMFLEMLEQLSPTTLPTHVFVQAGVGGLASVLCGLFWEYLGAARPIFVIVEPHRAACVFQSMRAGRLTRVWGKLDTIMAGLAGGVPSQLAWSILGVGADFALSISDRMAVEAMRDLALGTYGEVPVVAGESGIAGLAGVRAALARTTLRTRLRLNATSRVLVIGTEGATDPVWWQTVVGRHPADVTAP